ncbi:MAG: TonB-dependent receptor [Flavobacteriales bacterium]|nr:MAG: TonB-dependent receptor [Flavobacteriales bacterium]
MGFKCLKIIIPTVLMNVSMILCAQKGEIQGVVLGNEVPIPFVNLYLKGTKIGTASDTEGNFNLPNLYPGNYTLKATAMGYEPFVQKVNILENERVLLTISMLESSEQLDESVVTGTLKAVSRLESPVPVEVYSPTFLKRNPTPNIFEALQNVNGVRPQINCNVCNTGDIHINGLEGPYTLVLIDGMPIVSGLGTVYGLSGIPNSLIKQIEIVKGPASSLYGSEAVGGLINIITKGAQEAPEFFADSFLTGWGEYNLDLGSKLELIKNTDVLLGINYFNFKFPIDQNGDNFTDLTLQDRISIFQKWNVQRKDNRIFSLALRYFYEDRWGGETNWTQKYRGTDEIYGESIFTRRWEVLGQYQLPTTENIMFSFSFNTHNQNSVYGTTSYLAQQTIGFGQWTWDRSFDRHDMLFGAALRYNFYDDNTPATAELGINRPDRVLIPSLFVQDEWQIRDKNTLLVGARLDRDKRHGLIFTPRAALKWKFNDNDILRFNVGSGFRVVNLFTEEHAALTGAREIIVAEALKPERSVNFNLNFLKKIFSDNGTYIGWDASAFYTRFSNAILPDYDTDPNSIVYDNLDGKSISQGFSTNVDLMLGNGLKVMMGATYQDVSTSEEGVRRRQILTEKFSGTWSLSYDIRALDLSLDYTGNLYGPMRLPLLGPADPRREYSPVWSIQNIQLTYKGLVDIELYGGIKNLLDWTPNRGNPFIIARANDPFDKEVIFNANGNALATPNNPYALTFDPTYVYAPNQGIRGFLGLRYRLN